MIKSFRAQGYRKFKDITFADFDRVNLFLGNNNAGKTTILEALFAFTSGSDLEPLLSNAIRLKNSSPVSYMFMEMMLNLFNSRDELPLEFQFQATMDGGDIHRTLHYFRPSSLFADLEPTLLGSFGKGIRSDKDAAQFLGNWMIEQGYGDEQLMEYKSKAMELSFPFSIAPIKELSSNQVPAPPLLRSRFVDILTHRDAEENFKIYSFLKREKRGRLMAEFVKELAATFPNITGIDCLPYPTGDFGPVSFMTQESGLLPINSFGEGLQRWYNILGGMIVYQDAIHCIEEIDATFHPEAQKQLANNLVHYSQKYNNQLFMTSHSLEFVDNLLEAVYGSDQAPEEDCIRIITLRNDPKTNQVKSRVLTGQEAYESREKYRMELR